MLNIQSIISGNLYNKPSLFFAHTFGLQLGWSRSKVCQDAVYFQAATHKLLHTVFGEETKNGLDSGEVNEGQFSCGTFTDRWSDLSLIIGLSGQVYISVMKYRHISQEKCHDHHCLGFCCGKVKLYEIVSSAVAVDHRTSKRHWSN